jgi:hypothetical protein
MSDTELIDRLAELGGQLDAELTDAADGLADAVVAMIRVEQRERSSHRVFARRAEVWSIAAAVLLLVVVLVALPGPRRTVARWFGVGSVRIESVPTTPVSPPSPTAPDATAVRVTGSDAGPDTDPDPSSDPEPHLDDLGDDPLGLGPPIGADEAMAATGLPLPVASALGEPVSFHLPGGPQIVARYDVGGRAVLVAVLAGTTDDAAFVKQATSGQISPVDIPGVDGDSARGVWIEGEHVFDVYSIDADGELGAESLRVAGDTLLWERAGTTLRVEGARDLEEALEIAASMEP